LTILIETQPVQVLGRDGQLIRVVDGSERCGEKAQFRDATALQEHDGSGCPVFHQYESSLIFETRQAGGKFEYRVRV